MTAYILQCGCNGSYYHGKSQYYFNNRAVNRVNTKEEAAYNHIKYHLYHIQYVLFGDEVDTDTNQMDDGNNGSQSYISINAMITNLILSKASGRFTLMRLAEATSEPVLCICILAAKFSLSLMSNNSITAHLSHMTQVRPWRKT